MELQLLVDERSHVVEAIIDEPRDKGLIAPKEFCIGLFDKGDPEFSFVSATSKDQLVVAREDRELIIDDDVTPGEFLEETEDVDVFGPEFVENGRVHSLCERLRHVLIHHHPRSHKFTSCSCTTVQKLVTSGQHTHSPDEPTVTDLTLTHVVGAGVVFEESALFSTAEELTGPHPLHIFVSGHGPCALSWEVDGIFGSFLVTFELGAKVFI